MKRTAIDIIRQISVEVEERELPLEVMVRDIQMMQFKVRSLVGDISSLQSSQRDFIQALWRIGKIDEIVDEALYDLDEENQDALLSYFKSVEAQTRSFMKGVLVDGQDGTKQTKNHKNLLRLEIFKDNPVTLIAH